MDVNEPAIIVSEQPNDADRKAILDALVAFNEKTGGPSGFHPVAILIQDPASGKTMGGLWGRIGYDWLFVELLVIPEGFRGQDLGTRILTQAEDIARKHNCLGAWLDTFAFQAPGFYKKLGYEIFGTIEDHPRGLRRFFLKKNF